MHVHACVFCTYALYLCILVCKYYVYICLYAQVYVCVYVYCVCMYAFMFAFIIQFVRSMLLKSNTRLSQNTVGVV